MNKENYEELYVDGLLAGLGLQPQRDHRLPQDCPACVPLYGPFEAHRRGLIDGQRRRFAYGQ